MNQIHIIGAGPAGLMSAYSFALKGLEVHVYDHKKTAGRKFLVAGHGGFNLTHSDSLNQFVSYYNAPQIKEMIKAFDNAMTRDWLSSIGVETYVGSSGKIFPVKGIKPIDVLEKWLSHLKKLGVKFHYTHRLIDFSDKKLVFQFKTEIVELEYDRAVFAFGGKSWAKTGSDGTWVDLFNEKGIRVAVLEPSNSGMELVEPFKEISGKPLKNIRLFNELTERKGEIVFTDYGIEGAPVYFMNHYVRSQPFPQQLFVDLKPQFSQIEIEERLKIGKPTEALKNLKMDGAKLFLLKTLDKENYTDPEKLSKIIKGFPLSIKGFRPIDEVISTYGGVEWDELNTDLSLVKFPKIQCCGEMLNWDAPTGGYLLQGCFSSGAWLAR